MQEKELQELNTQLEAAGIEPIANSEETPERTAFFRHLQNPKWDDAKWVKKYKSLKESYALAFHTHFAHVHPHVLYEVGEERVYWIYDDARGVYDECAASTVREMVINLLIKEGLGDKATEGFAKNCLARYRAMYPERGARYDDFDASDVWFHAKNGWVNLETEVFEEHTPYRLSRRVSDVEYDPEATCPTYDAFLDADVQVAADAVRVIDQFSGLILTNDVRYQKMLTIIGRPGSGKSTLLEVWSHILGDLAIQKRLTDLQGDSFRFAGADLVGRSLCWFDEVDVKRAEMGNTLGNLITGTSINVERKGINGIVRARNALKCVLTANSLPMSAEHGAYRRLILVKFDRSFYDEGTQKTDVLERLKEEAPGILNRMIRGLKDLRKMGNFTVISGHEDLIEEYKAQSDMCAEFLDTYFVPAKMEETVSTVELFEAYKHFAGKQPGLVLTPQRFGRMLGAQPLVRFAHITSKLKKHHGTPRRVWCGIRLKDEYMFDEYGAIVPVDGQDGQTYIRDVDDDDDDSDGGF